MKSIRLILFPLLVHFSCVSYGQVIETICYSDSVIIINKDEKFELTFGACHDCGARWFLESIDTTGIILINTIKKQIHHLQVIQKPEEVSSNYGLLQELSVVNINCYFTTRDLEGLYKKEKC